MIIICGSTSTFLSISKNVIMKTTRVSYVCKYMCVYECIYTHTHAHTHTYKHTHTRARAHKHTHTHTRAHTYTHAHTRMHTRIRVRQRESQRERVCVGKKKEKVCVRAYMLVCLFVSVNVCETLLIFTPHMSCHEYFCCSVFA